MCNDTGGIGSRDSAGYFNYSRSKHCPLDKRVGVIGETQSIWPESDQKYFFAVKSVHNISMFFIYLFNYINAA